MTVSTEVDHNDYTGNGVTTSFPYTFRIFKKSDLTVQLADLNENITVLTLDTDYSVTGAGTYSGGNVVLMSPLANGWQISISRDLPVTQETDLRNQGKFFAEVHEDAFDKLTMLIQQCFSFLRLALRKPSFIANYYDALNNRIRNLRDPSQAQDAATKNYVDGKIVDNTNAWKAGDNVLDQKIDANFQRTIRVPENSVEVLHPVEIRKNSLFGWNDLGRPVPIFTMTDTADLALRLSDSNGAYLVGYRYSDVYSVLSRMLCYQDYNVNQPALGRDQAANQVIWDEQTSLDLKHRGGIFAGKDTFGIRENATVASFRANTSSGSAFVPQVAGSDDVAVLAQSGALDSVTLFADNWVGKYLDWESFGPVTYTSNSFTVTDISTLENVKVGQFVITKHSSPYVGLITSINGLVVSVQKWVIYGTSTVGTPADGTGLYINPVIKAWAINGNVLIGENSRAQKCALMELGLQNNGISDITLLTGADVVMLSGTYGGGDGARIRGSSAVSRWDNNVHAYAGVKTNFRSSDGSSNSTCNIAAFLEESASNIGFKFSGRNVSRSMSWVSDTTGLETKALAPWGHRIIDGSSFATLSNGGSPGTTAFVWFVGNSSAFSIVLPNPANFTPGREFEFILASTATVTFTNAGGTVNGASSYAITPSYSFSRVKAIYGGSNNWYVTR
ncbi:hypothetical protein [Klebsiella quasipneumoniae]|uniref:hypothetical protein n=1 Tax=Klebsiella quasipneumoniae TaxID=1463165 RepID=UPI0035B118E2